MEKQENPQVSNDERAKPAQGLQNAANIDTETQQALQKLVQPKVHMQWITPAYRQTEKSKGWYLIMGLIVLIFVIYGMFSGDSSGWIVSITFLVLAATYYLTEMKPAPAVKVQISQLGVTFGPRFIPYNQMKSFWLLNEQNARHLNLTLLKGASRNLSIIVPEEVNMARLREYLLRQIPEEEGREESFTDQLIRNLGL
jgi:hypothetical protein